MFVTAGLGALTFAGGAGCFRSAGPPPGPVRPAPAYGPGLPFTVAIVPFSNDTLSVDGPAVLRTKLAATVAGRGYQVQPIKETDERLRAIGITLGGQMSGAKIEDLRKALGTDAIVGGRLLKHQNVVLGVVDKQTLEASANLVDLSDGRLLWSVRDKVVDEQQFTPVASGGDGREQAAVCLIGGLFGIANGVARNAMGPESEKLAVVLVQTMPPPGAGYAFVPPTAAAEVAADLPAASSNAVPQPTNRGTP